MSLATYAPCQLIQTCHVPLPDGRDIEASMYATQRRTGRRIVCRHEGQVVFDTDDCFDRDNAMSRLNEWFESVGQSGPGSCRRSTLSVESEPGALAASGSEHKQP